MATTLPRNDELADQLGNLLLADLCELEGEDSFRVLAYRRAAGRIRETGGPVAQLALDGKAKNLTGIGKTIEEKIVEVVELGEMKALTKRKAIIPPEVVKFMHLPGLGPKTARRIWQELGVTTLDELKAAAEQERLRSLAGLGAKSETNTLRGARAGAAGSTRVEEQYVERRRPAGHDDVLLAACCSGSSLDPETRIAAIPATSRTRRPPAIALRDSAGPPSVGRGAGAGLVCAGGPPRFFFLPFAMLEPVAKAVYPAAYRLPGVPRDAQDHDRDREADQRIGDLEAERDDGGAGDDGQADVRVGAGVVAVGDQRGAVEPAARARTDPAAIQLPAKPSTPAAASAARWSGSRGSISRRTDS